jgi:hypothetical protein
MQCLHRSLLKRGFRALRSVPLGREGDNDDRYCNRRIRRAYRRLDCSAGKQGQADRDYRPVERTAASGAFRPDVGRLNSADPSFRFPRALPPFRDRVHRVERRRW